MTINREEIFGPVAAVIRVKNYDEALAVANDTPFGLSSGIATTSLKYAEHFKRNSPPAWSWSTCRPRASTTTCRSAGARLELRTARAGTLRGRVLHHGQDELHQPVMELRSRSGNTISRSFSARALREPVYLAKDTFTGKEVALKTIEPEVFRDPQFGPVYRSQF